MAEAVFAISLIMEMVALFAIWSLSIKGRVVLAIAVASALAFAPVIASIVLGYHLPARVYLAFGGMYVFSGLIWRWWKDGVAPERWGVGEFILAVVAVMMFSIANGAWR